jgi:hypothetical protein
MPEVKDNSPEKLTFEFMKGYTNGSGVKQKEESMMFGGEIQSIDWETEKAIVNVHDTAWSEVTGTSAEKVEVTLFNLIFNTAKVSSKNYNQLEEMLKMVYPVPA